MTGFREQGHGTPLVLLHGISSGGDGGQKAVGIAGGGEYFYFFAFHGKTNGPWPKVEIRRREAGGAAAHE